MPQSNENGEQDAWREEVATSGSYLQGSNAEARTELTQKAAGFFKSTVSSGQPAAHMACTCPAGSIALIHFDILHRGSRQFFETCGNPDTPLPFRQNEVCDPAHFWPTFASLSLASC